MILYTLEDYGDSEDVKYETKTDSLFGDTVCCPHCKNKSKFEPESLSWADDSEDELICPVCDKEFISEVKIIYERKSRFKDETLS